MVEYDYSKLLGRMKEMGKTQEQLARSIRKSPATLNLKLHNKSDFSQGEILLICAELRINSIMIPDYFFTPILMKTQESSPKAG